MGELHYKPEISELPRLAESIREGVVFYDSGLIDDLYFDPVLGGLAKRDASGLRLMVFRGHLPQSEIQVKPDDLLNRSFEQSVYRNSVSGKGLYAGNSAQSIGVFATEGSPREIGVYLTPPLHTEDILVLARTRDDRRNMLINFSKEVADYVQSLTGQTANHHDQLYQNKKLIVLDMHVGSRGAQWIQLQKYQFPVRPLWYLWRDRTGIFERVGTFEQRPHLRSIVRALVNRQTHKQQPKK